MAWQVDFFVDEHGHAPVEDYLTSVPVEHRAKLLALVKVLGQEGANLPFPYCSQVRGLVERELENLQVGVQIAKLRAEENLSQTKLAALAEMSAPKISAMENEPRNLTIGTLIRVAHALDSRVEIKLVRRKGTKPFEDQ